MTVFLRDITPNEYENWRAESLGSYAEELEQSGNHDAEQAKIKAEQSFKELLPAGMATKDHFIFTICNESEIAIGVIWFHLKRGVKPSAFIYDIVISDKFRGQGFGRQALRVIEKKMADLGATASALHVFAHNKVAVHLYQSSGYQVTNLNMRKDF